VFIFVPVIPAKLEFLLWPKARGLSPWQNRGTTGGLRQLGDPSRKKRGVPLRKRGANHSTVGPCVKEFEIAD
jgi:hypothetical protein